LVPAFWVWRDSEKEDYIGSGKMIHALERILRLKGIRYVEFADLASFMIHVPMMFIYRKRSYAGIGYATFEKELYEALRVYNSLLTLPEGVRHFIFQSLVADEVRIFGFQAVASYLTYENMTKLLLLTLIGSRKLEKRKRARCLNFLALAEKIEKRYEAINDFLSAVSGKELFESRDGAAKFFKAKSGITLRKDETHGVLTVDFVDKVNMGQKLKRLGAIGDVDNLKKYFHVTLQALRNLPFQTEDYEVQLEKAFEQRLSELTELTLERARKQMEESKDFNAIHGIFMDLMEKSLDIGLSDEQRHRLSDLYELTKENLRREKLMEIGRDLDIMHDEAELRGYWSKVKWYLLNNRPFLGKEFENLIAKKVDDTMETIRERRRAK